MKQPKQPANPPRPPTRRALLASAGYPYRRATRHEWSRTVFFVDRWEFVFTCLETGAQRVWGNAVVGPTGEEN